ncbi:MAG: GcrA cell cycle regulator, partial [Candidatus Pelagibacter sp.]|nr:GcrA cell cycle regulator [Candidatus Pelagibacter sp.]
MAWTFERVELLTTLWKSGNSASQIANELGEGVSRNAVIGKIHRLGLSERSNNSKDESDSSIKPSLSNKEKKLAPLSTIKGVQSSDIDEKPTVKAKTGKKRGRKPSKKNIEKSQNDIDQKTKNESVFSDVAEVFPGISAATELDKKALADMIELEKRAKKLSLMELTERTCKWPIGDPATDEFWFCGHQAENGKPYCKTHVAIAFQPVSTRR